MRDGKSLDAIQGDQPEALVEMLNGFRNLGVKKPKPRKTPMTCWVPVEVKDKYDEVQRETGQLAAKVAEFLAAAIEIAHAELRAKNKSA